LFSSELLCHKFVGVAWLFNADAFVHGSSSSRCTSLRRRLSVGSLRRRLGVGSLRLRSRLGVGSLRLRLSDCRRAAAAAAASFAANITNEYD
jgi:hypothetical protein